MTEESDIQQQITETQYAATSGTGDAAIYITNYHYQSPKNVTETSDKLDNAYGNKNFLCPYQGLYHFSPKDSQFFFGREGVIQELFEKAQISNFIPVLGASGIGKSSVILAGLVPRLYQQSNWLFAYFRPRSDPFYALAEALVLLERTPPNSLSKMNTSDNKLNNYEINKVKEIADCLKHKKKSLSEIIRCIKQKKPKYRLLLIADQFEEIYTLLDDQEIRNNFLNCLLSLVQSSIKSPYTTVVVATIRADFLGSMLSYRPFAQLLKNNIKIIIPMNDDEMTEAIIEPAKILKVQFEEGLVERILKDVANEPGDLTLLEFALRKLWSERDSSKLTHEVYKKIGQVQGALTNYADEEYKKMKRRDQGKQVQKIFMQLVNLGEGGVADTRRLVTKAQLGEENWPLVVELANSRLVVTSRNTEDQETVEIVHEALISRWHELRGWIDNNRSVLKQQRVVEAKAEEWNINGKDQSYLLRGKQLDNSKKLLEQQMSTLIFSNLAKSFLKTSDNYEKKEEMRTKLLSKRTPPKIVIDAPRAFIVIIVVISIIVGSIVALVANQEIRKKQLWLTVESKQEKSNNLIQVQAIQELVKMGETLADKEFKGYSLSRIDLSGVALTNSDFSYSDLSYSKLINSSLLNTNFSNANLSHSNLTSASLISVKLSSTELMNANLQSADLFKANLSNANLQGANFQQAILQSANLQGANLQGAKYLTSQQVKTAKNWEKACYEPELNQELGLPLKNLKSCQRKTLRR